MNQLIPVAIAYDFDGTLAPGNMQEFSCFPELGLKKEEFWNETRNILSPDNDMDEILAYMHLMLLKSDSIGGITKEFLESHSRDIIFFKGVETWFKVINNYATSIGIELQHYVVSCGLREMIRATKIGEEFKYVFASGFMYNDKGKAVWPALAVNYTTKTQYLFRINKGVLNSYENEPINNSIPRHKKKIPFSNIIYIGDGDTDVPSMKVTMQQGGRSIAVYNPGDKEKERECKKLQLQNRTNYYAPADYSKDGRLNEIVVDILDYISSCY